MIKPAIKSSCSKLLRRLFFFLFLLAAIQFPKNAFAHPMPNSVVLMDIKADGVRVELQLPLSELQVALGSSVVFTNASLSQEQKDKLKQYILSHIKASTNGKVWAVVINDFSVDSSEQYNTSPYKELKVHLWMQSPKGVNPRTFLLNYDVIVHQLITHKILVSLRQDWEAGVTSAHPVEVGVISMDTRENIVQPFTVNLAEGSNWKGFTSMVSLGIEHIKEGTDHLLFLLVLLLPAPLLVQRKRWSSYGGAKYSSIRILKIVTAFTIGHSLTLLLGSLGWVRFPSQPVEILIAFSILISSVHAIRPIFAGKEIFVAAGFGLVHGLAFAGTLSDLNLEAGPMALSILGFNIGIELMQIFVIVISFPWLIMLSRTSWYRTIRLTGASLAGIASVAWMVQRITNQDNIFTTGIEAVAVQARWMILGLATAAIVAFLIKQSKARRIA